MSGKVIDVIPKIAQYEEIEYAPDFMCPNCEGSGVQHGERPLLVGWCETNNGYMAVFECPVCHSKYRFHPHLNKFDLDSFDFYLGAYYVGLNCDLGWCGNSREINDRMKNYSNH